MLHELQRKKKSLENIYCSADESVIEFDAKDSVREREKKDRRANLTRTCFLFYVSPHNPASSGSSSSSKNERQSEAACNLLALGWAMRHFVCRLFSPRLLSSGSSEALLSL